MGLFDWFKSDEPDETLFEVSNYSGDHWIASIPTKGSADVCTALLDAGAVRDDDDQLLRKYQADLVIEARNQKTYRFKSSRVVDESEDLEANGDLEDDRTRDYELTTDYDESKVPEQFRWW